jgi:hypothetical protein
VAAQIATGELFLAYKRTTVELSNGWLITIAYNSTDRKFYGYISENYGGTWDLLFTKNYQYNLGYDDVVNVAMESTRTMLHVFIGRYVYSFDATAHVRGSELQGAYELLTPSIYSDFDNVKFMQTVGNTVHTVGVRGRTNTSGEYGYDVVYREGAVNSGVNWSSIEPIDGLTFMDDLLDEVSMTVHNNKPFFVYPNGGNVNNRIMYKAHGGQSGEIIYGGYNRFPDITKDKNGTLHVVFLKGGNIYYSFSSDGVAWVVPIEIYTAADATEVKITVDQYNAVYVFYKTSANTIKYIKQVNTVWESERAVATNAEHISLTYDHDLNSNVVGYTYQDVTYNSVHFDKLLINKAPLMPELKQKENFDSAFESRFEWSFEDEDINDSQSAYQFQLIRDSDGSLLIDTGKVLSPNQFYDLSVGILTNNENYSWRVKTWDNWDVEGPYSYYGTFYTNEQPTVMITSPTEGYINNTATITAKWTMNDPLNELQSAFQVILRDDGNVVFDSGKVAGINTREYVIPFALENYRSYTIEVRVWDEWAISSVYDSVEFVVDYVKPVIPLVEATANSEDASIILKVTNPSPTNGEPEALSVEIYRREENGRFIRIVKGLQPNSMFVDYTPANGTQYSYYVRVFADDYTFADSAIVDLAVNFKHAKLNLTSNYATYFTAKYNVERSLNYNKQMVLAQFAGRKYSSAEFGQFEELGFDITFACKDQQELDAFLDVYTRYETLLYRDYRGRRAFVVANNVNVKDQRGGLYEVTFSPQRVDYHEEV